jgi:DNA-binding response OmpR family regulator
MTDDREGGESMSTPDGAGEPVLDVLVVDDDATVAEVVAVYLTRAGYTVRHAADGPAAVAAAAERLPDLMVLDLMLPGFDGYEVHQRVRALGEVPVIMLTARGEEGDRILGLQVGADDYVTKPFSPRELVLRAGSVLRRSRGHGRGRDAEAPQAPEILTAGGLEVDLTAHRARLAGEPLALTGREFDLLAFLMANPGQAFSRAELMQQVWGWSFGDQSTVTVHVRRLREKIEPDPAAPTLIVTVWGVGYRWEAGAAAEPPSGTTAEDLDA